MVVQVNVESVDEAVSYVLALGASVAVISPKKVREAVAVAARAIAAIYES
jgi:predicted DNA-binding transcriptional regulator YafY